MQSLSRRIRLTITFLFLIFAAVGISTIAVHEDVQAATANGFVTRNGKTYYYKNGQMVKGGFIIINKKAYYFGKDGVQAQSWTTINNHRYYFACSKVPQERVMFTGYHKDSKGVLRVFSGSGILCEGLKTLGGKLYYFDPKNYGGAVTGWLTYGNCRYFFRGDGTALTNIFLYDKTKKAYRYFDSRGRMARSWTTFSGGKKRYFSSTPNAFLTDGLMKTGFTRVGNYFYYFSTSSDASKVGFLVTGWVTNQTTGVKYYLDPAKGGALLVNTTKVIDGVTYVFDTGGRATVKTIVSQTTNSAKTIKNYLQNALQPVGQCLYIWGGWGHGTTKGVPSEWKTFYDSHASSSYNYHNYEFQRTKGLDCSGFVGWAAYQVMQSKSNVGYGYTVVSGEVGSSYVSRGWGSIITQSKLSSSGYKIYPGDVGFDEGHTWIMLGQCSDKSCVVLHSTNHGGVQLAGTPTPDGNYSSRAVALAKYYMSKYPNYQKFTSLYKPSTGNFIRRGNFLRWNRATLADPDGYLNKTADQILADLYK